MGRAKERTRLVFAATLVAATLSPAAVAKAELPALGINEIALQAAPSEPAMHDLAAKAEQLGSSNGVPTRIWRVELGWQFVQPTQGGGYNWAPYRQIYDVLHAHGIKPLWMVMRAPQWARNPLDLCPFGFSAGTCPPANGQLGAWQSFVTEAVRQFPDSAGIEVWNEPNYKKFWPTLSGPSVPRYVGVLATAYAGVQQAEAELAPSMPPGWEMPVLLGGPADPGSQDGIARNAWLEGIYAYQGQSRYFDILSAHVYPIPQFIPPDQAAQYSLLGELGEIASIRDTVGDPSMPIWLTETGYHTDGCGAFGCPVAVEDQGPFLSCAYGLLIDTPYNVDAFLIHQLVDWDDGVTPTERSFGLLRSDLSHKATPPNNGYSVLQDYFSTTPAPVTNCD